MDNKVIINAKGDKELKEAIRIVAYNQGHSNSSKTIVDILKADPQIAKALQKAQRRCKNKSSSV